MEVSRSTKGLSKHAVPVIIVLAAFMILPVAGAVGYDFGWTADSAAKGLVTRVVNIQPSTSGLSDVTFTVPQPSATPAGSYLDNGPGQVAQLFIKL